MARVLIAVVVCLINIGAAQQRNNELGFLLGGQVNSSIEISGTSASLDRDTGLIYQVTYARRLAGSATGVWFEVPLLAVPLVKLSSNRPPAPFPTDYAALFITPGVRIQLSSGHKVLHGFRPVEDTFYFRPVNSSQTERPTAMPSLIAGQLSSAGGWISRYL